MKYLYLLLVFGLFPLFSGNFTKEEFSEMLSSELMCNIHLEVCRKGELEGLTYTGKGGCYIGGLSDVRYSFQVQRAVGKKTAEQLMAKMVSHVIQIYNRHEDLAPFFRDFPISSDMVSLGIYFVDEQGRGLITPDLYGVLQMDDRLIFLHEDFYKTHAFSGWDEEQHFSKITMDNLFTDEIQF